MVRKYNVATKSADKVVLLLLLSDKHSGELWITKLTKSDERCTIGRIRSIPLTLPTLPRFEDRDGSGEVREGCLARIPHNRPPANRTGKDRASLQFDN